MQKKILPFILLSATLFFIATLTSKNVAKTPFDIKRIALLDIKEDPIKKGAMEHTKMIQLRYEQEVRNAKEAEERLKEKQRIIEEEAKAKAEEEAKIQEEEEAKAKAEEEANISVNDSNSDTKSGRTLVMESTAYSAAESGASNLTATGQDLNSNPMAIAVDPSIIPLGTLLYVEGYGQAYAVDTGGAINGNIVDLHFPTVEQCDSWGRRQVNVTILD